MRLRFPLLLLVFLSLLAALWAGLVRLGWSLPPIRLLSPMLHGPLMVSGFLGTLIGIERAVALRQKWAYLGPAASGLGAMALMVGLPVQVGAALMVLSGAGLTAVSFYIYRQHPTLHTATMGAGAVAWLAGSSLWLAGWPIYRVVLWWAGFLVLTIVGERLELSRIRRLDRQSYWFFGTAVFLFGSGLVWLLFAGAGVRLASLGLLAVSLWLLRYDIARFTVRKTELTRYMAVNLLLGYGWLAVGGVVGLVFGEMAAGFRYDAWLHAIFLGFVFGMIFAHALIILPSVTGIAVPYHRGFYGATAVLQLSLLLRIGGDLMGWLPARQWGGLLNEVVVLGFFIMVAGTAVLSKKEFG